MFPSVSADEIIRYASSFLGGGVVVAVGNWIHSNWSASRAREVEVLGEQLRLLYGPLYFFTGQNERLFALSGKVGEAYKQHFEGKNWSHDPGTQEALEKQTLSTIELGNMYIRRVVENNARVMDLLEKNWHLVDPSDVEVLSRFQVDYTRYLVEAQEGRKDVPFGVVMRLGPIPFMHRDVITRAREVFERKRARLVNLTGSSE